MEVVLNATLAGGVAIGSSADVTVDPWVPLFVGSFSGMVSALSFTHLNPYLQ